MEALRVDDTEWWSLSARLLEYLTYDAPHINRFQELIDGLWNKQYRHISNITLVVGQLCFKIFVIPMYSILHNTTFRCYFQALLGFLTVPIIFAEYYCTELNSGIIFWRSTHRASERIIPDVSEYPQIDETFHGLSKRYSAKIWMSLYRYWFI